MWQILNCKPFFFAQQGRYYVTKRPESSGKNSGSAKFGKAKKLAKEILYKKM